MKLDYNIYFEVSAALFMIVLAYFVRWQYNMTTSKNKSFFRMLLFVIAANILDVITAITISNAAFVPYSVNMLLNLLYFILIVLLSAQFLDYSFELTEKGKYYKTALVFEYILSGCFVILLFVNLFTGVIYDFENDQYTHGPLYILVYIVPYIMLGFAAIIMLLNLKKWEKNRRLSIILYFVVCFSGVILQLFFFPNVLLNLFTISLSVVIILFAMETQDYQQLVRTLDDMRVLNEKTQAAIEVKKRFIDNISTNIRNPVINIIDIDERLLCDLDDEKNVNLVEENENIAIELIGVLDDILEFSEAEVNDIVIKEEAYNVRGAVESCIKSIKKKAEDKDLKITLDYDKTLPDRLYGDRDRISQILRELLVNAVTNTDEGGIVIKVTWKDYDKRHILLLISVEDTGKGIPESMKKTIFDSFETANEGSSGNGKRIGLGLAYAKKLVEVMNGDIGVYSKEGEGSLFYIEFPQKVHES